MDHNLLNGNRSDTKSSADIVLYSIVLICAVFSEAKSFQDRFQSGLEKEQVEVHRLASGSPQP